MAQSRTQGTYEKLLDNNTLQEDQRKVLKLGLTSKQQDTQDLVSQAVIKDTVASETVDLFKATSDISTLLILSLCHAIVCSLALSASATIKVVGNRLYPDLWTICLASSCSGKSFALGIMMKMVSCPLFPGSNSTAALIENIREFNKTGWFIDEFAQLLKSMNNQKFAEEMREIFLKLYGNDQLSRITKSEKIIVDDPALMIFGLTVTETFLGNVTAESFLDGFMQRFLMIKADKDPNRTTPDFPIYRTPEHESYPGVREAWEKLSSLPIHAEYIATDDAVAEYEKIFRDLYGHEDMPDSFYRRILWATFKYALSYHLMLGKTSAMIDAEDIHHASVMTRIHLSETCALIKSYDDGKLGELAEKAVRMKNRIGRLPSSGELIAGVRAIPDAKTAKRVLSLIA